jgi:hypothetical protein
LEFIGELDRPGGGRDQAEGELLSSKRRDAQGPGGAAEFDAPLLQHKICGPMRGENRVSV